MLYQIFLVSLNVKTSTCSSFSFQESYLISLEQWLQILEGMSVCTFWCCSPLTSSRITIMPKILTFVFPHTTPEGVYRHALQDLLPFIAMVLQVAKISQVLRPGGVFVLPPTQLMGLLLFSHFLRRLRTFWGCSPLTSSNITIMPKIPTFNIST